MPKGEEREPPLTRRRAKEHEYAQFKPPFRSTELFGQQSVPPTGSVEIVVQSGGSWKTVRELETILERRKDREHDESSGEEDENEESVKGTEETKEKQETKNEKNEVMADTTIRQALATAKTPATPKFLSPPSFNPATVDPNTFIQTYNRVALANAWDDNLKIAYLPIFLEKAASVWYNEYTGEAQNATKTWRQLVADFLEEFGRGNSTKNARMRFESRKQGVNEDIKSYYFELLSLQQEYDPQMSDATFRMFFEEGLLPQLAETFLMFSDPEMSKRDIKNLVFKISEVKKKSLINNISADSAFVTMNDRTHRQQTEANREEVLIEKRYPCIEQEVKEVSVVHVIPAIWSSLGSLVLGEFRQKDQLRFTNVSQCLNLNWTLTVPHLNLTSTANRVEEIREQLNNHNIDHQFSATYTLHCDTILLIWNTVLSVFVAYLVLKRNPGGIIIAPTPGVHAWGEESQLGHQSTKALTTVMGVVDARKRPVSQQKKTSSPTSQPQPAPGAKTVFKGKKTVVARELGINSQRTRRPQNPLKRRAITTQRTRDFQTLKKLHCTLCSVAVKLINLNIFKKDESAIFTSVHPLTPDHQKIILDALGSPGAKITPINKPAKPQPPKRKDHLPSFSCVLRHVDEDINDTDILEACSEQGYHVTKVWRIISRKTGKSTDLYRLLTREQETLDKLLKKGLILFSKLHRCEPSQVPPVTQAVCARCQTVGHSQDKCPSSSIKCPKCGETHKLHECTSELTRCVNCEGEHLTFSKNCPARKAPIATNSQATYVQIVKNSRPETAEPVTVDQFIRALSFVVLNLFPDKRHQCLGFNAVFHRRYPAQQGQRETRRVAILIKKGFAFSEHQLPNNLQYLDCIAVDTYIDSNIITFFTYYNFPRQCLSNELMQYAASLPKAIILGDFNARHTDFGDTLTNRNGHNLFDAISNLPLYRIPNSFPTHINH
ncbi:hypothetical protein TcasGA2_TC033481 [Tribolium castaneum]|uniref:Retrotransposon gag domain-containing protein n=1 Tax=Tribolium castaneum TaxID=7070 RepID=A0A139WG58_TRICA|nr:hypothetical protein TcasGA2_TC033481 [Tribolium castaneum]